MSCAKRCLLFIACVLLILSGIAAAGLYCAGRWLHHADAAGKADAILVLGGDPARALEGAELYKSGLAPVIYISAPVRDSSQALLDRFGVSWPLEEDVTRRVLQARGVPDRDIRLLGRELKSTAMEARTARDVLPGKSLLVVTSPYHTRRAWRSTG
jgi:uncharacterized SAM-binding protein YcdF (DUF218 family)